MGCRRRLGSILCIISCAIFSLSLSAKSGASAPPCPELIAGLEANKFESERFASDYVRAFGPRFEQAIIRIQWRGGLWLDSGAGNAFALNFFLSRFERLKGIALNFRSPDLLMSRLDLQDHRSRLKVFEGRLLESYSPEELESPELISDFMGPFSYSMDPALVLNLYLQAIKNSGEIYIRYSTRHNELVSLEDGSNRSIGIREWLSRGHGFEWSLDDPIAGVIRIVKRGSEARVPNLQLVSYQYAEPPIRKLGLAQSKANEGFRR